MPEVKHKEGGSRFSIENDKITFTDNYLVLRAQNPAQATSAVAQTCPLVLSYQGHYLLRRRIDTSEVSGQRGLYESTVTYETLPNVESLAYEGSTNTTTVRVYNSKMVVYAKALTGRAPNLGGLIGYRDGQIEGCEVLIPQPEFSLILDGVTLEDPNQFLRMASVFTAKVNSNVYLGFQPGELLFKGASVSGKAGDRFRISLSFLAQPNLYSFTLGDFFIPQKLGWDYLDVLYVDTVDQGVLIKRPFAVYIHRVYDFVPYMFPIIDF